jgi:cytochrome c oxidase subunit 2
VFFLRICALAGVALALTTACGGSSNSQATSGSPNGDVAKWVQMERLPAEAVPGASLYSSEGCGACHTYAGSGHANMGAPDLTAYGRLNLGTAFDIHFLRCPSCVKSGSPMPAFDTLGEKRLRQLAIFLEASKGIR